jgi:hypothetical protein
VADDAGRSTGGGSSDVVQGWRRGLNLDWAFDLTSADPTRRARALARHHQVEGRWWEALQRVNALWQEAGTLWPATPHLTAAMDQAISAEQDAHQHRFLGAVWAWLHGDGPVLPPPLAHPPPSLIEAVLTGTAESLLVKALRRPEDSPLLPFALVFLEWEASYPNEWHKDWWTKKQLLRRFSRLARYDQAVRRRLGDLVMAAVARRHRCEDQGYGAVARAIADEGLRQRLERAAGSPDVLTRQRACFLLFLVDHPEAPSRPQEWKRWLQQGCPLQRGHSRRHGLLPTFPLTEIGEAHQVARENRHSDGT